MNLQLSDVLSDERAEWQVIGRLYSTAGGKTVHVRVESVKQPGVTDIRTWGAPRTRRGEAGMMRVLAALVLVLFATAGCSSVSICLEQEKGVSASEDPRSQGCAPNRPTRSREREQEMRDGQARSGIANRTEKLYQRG